MQLIVALIKRRYLETKTDMHRGKTRWRRTVRTPSADWGLERCIYKPMNTKDCRKPPNAQRGTDRFPYGFQRKHGPANTLILDFQCPDLWNTKQFCCFKSPRFFFLTQYSSPKKQIHHFPVFSSGKILTTITKAYFSAHSSCKTTRD